MNYTDFINSKRKTVEDFGFELPIEKLNKSLFDWQAKVVHWALRRGRAGLFEGTGLGKSLQQLAWAEQIVYKTNLPVVIHTPVGVRQQTEREAAKFAIGCPVKVVNKQSEIVRDGINLINYEKLHLFDASIWGGVVLDEASILRDFTGKTKQELCRAYERTQYRLSCTATPAPNDHMELGNQSQFLGVLPSSEMLSRWFINDTMKAGGYRLRQHAQKDFWKWMSRWAVCISKPSEIGGSDEGYILPDLRINRHIIDSDNLVAPPGQLFPNLSVSATTIHDIKRQTNKSRAKKTAELSKGDEPCLIWCDTNYEADELASLLPEAVEVRGSDSESEKERKLSAFSTGEERLLITKPSIAGLGMNWQHCQRMIFHSISFSWESYYQAVRRCWRFGQTRPVDVHIILAECDDILEKAIANKANDHELMRSGMSEAMLDSMQESLFQEVRQERYKPMETVELPNWLNKTKKVTKEKVRS